MDAFEPTVRHVVQIGGRKRTVYLPRRGIQTTFYDGARRVFLQLKLSGKVVPCYLSGSRFDFRTAYVVVNQVNEPEPLWIMKFRTADRRRTTRLHDDIQRALGKHLRKIKLVKMSSGEFAKLWLVNRHARVVSNAPNKEEFQRVHLSYLERKLVPVKPFLQH